MFKKSFLSSKAIGDHGEELVLNLFNKFGIKCEKNEDKETRLDYDLLCELGRKKFNCEVKFDKMAQKTGNLAIEFFNSNKGAASGIGVTKADLWVHIVLDGDHPTIWAASVPYLRQWINAHKPKRVVEMAGDGNASLYLYSDEDILDIALLRLDTLDEKELKKVIRKLLNDLQ